MKYLYGASVKNIQSFIFETNDLKDIIGASEIIELICTSQYKKDELCNINDENKIVSAAGNIRLIVENKHDIEKLVLSFPKIVQEIAPNVTLIQAVVKIDGDLNKDCIDELENKLIIQKNKINRQPFITALGIERSRRTGNPAVDRNNKGLQDLPSKLKSKKSQPDRRSKVAAKIIKNYDPQQHPFPSDLVDIIDNNFSSWLAVIHADGNDLGKHIRSLQLEKDFINEYKTFSAKLEISTINAAQAAFKDHIHPKKNKAYPFRPVILGGDDLTVICRADLAIPFTKSFLKNFEIQTFKHINKKITACAGISFVKVKYPFHYAIDLANQLCTYAKKISKEKYIQNKLAYVPSSIMFHKIQSSFIESFSDIKKRELKADASNVDFCFGPYFIEKINSDLPTLEHLCSVVNECKNDDFPSTSLRQWLSELHDNKNRAQRLWERIIQVNENFEKTLSQYHYKENNNKTMIYDALSYLSLCSKGGIECLN